MRPSRPQLVIFGIALLGLSLQRLVPPFLFEHVQDVTYYFLFNSGVELLVFGLAVGYAYGLGRTGRAGTPITVARQYLVAGVAAVGCIWAVLFFWSNAPTFDRPVQTLAMLLSTIVGFVLPFLFAGLAGVPLGAMYGREDDDKRDSEDDDEHDSERDDEHDSEGQDEADADADFGGQTRPRPGTTRSSTPSDPTADRRREP